MHVDDNTRPDGAYSPTRSPVESTGVDWPTVSRLLPALVCVLAWLLWAAFLLIPTLYDLHGVHLFPVENNLLFTLTGFVFVLMVSVFTTDRHYIRAVLFLGVVLYLAWWF